MHRGIGSVVASGMSFSLDTDKGVKIRVFTTRIETLAGVTFAAIAPDSPLLAELLPFAAIGMLPTHTSLRAGHARTGIA